MDIHRSIKINMIMSIILTSSNFIFPLITYAYVARILLPVGTGKVAFVQSVLAYFSYIAALGVSGYGMRECARVRDDKDELSKLTQELLLINFFSTIVAYTALVVSIFLVAKFREYSALFIIMSLSILLQTLGMEWLYNALEKYTYITIRSLFFKVVAVVLTFLLVKSPEDYIVYGGITIFSSSASNILNFINARKYISLKKFKSYRFKRHLKPIMVFFMSTIIISIYGHFDSLMLGFLKGDSDVGIYNTALKMKSIVLSVSTAVTSVLIPRMSACVGKGYNEKFYDLLTKSLRVSMVLVLPLAVFILINARDVLLFVCGPEYLSATSTLRILMLCVFALMLTNLLGNQVLIPKGNENRYSQSVLIGMFINLFLNMLLIPHLASPGAAIATLATESFNVYWMGIGCKEEVRYLVSHLKVQQYFYPLMLAILAEIVVKNLLSPLGVFLRLSIGSIIMFGIYYIILMIKKEPIIVIAKRSVHNVLSHYMDNIS